MHVALITQRFPPLCCGVGDYALGLARALRDQGHGVTVITRPASGDRAEGIRVVEAPLGGWRDLRGLLRVIEREGVARVQLEYSGYGWSRWGFSIWLNALVAVLRWRGNPVNLGLHETYIRFVDHPLQIPISLAQRVHIWMLMSSANAVFLSTPERVRVHRRWLPWCRGRIHYRPNSSTIPVVGLEGDARRGLRTLRGAEPNDCVVATFGLFQKDKNLEAVIDAVARARTARPLRLWLLGDARGAPPAYIAELRDRARAAGIEARVVWSGYLPPEEVSAHLQAADLFVLPQPDGHLTRSSAFMAAAAHGLPVIAVRNAKNQAEFRHGHNVWLVSTSSAEELGAALSALGNDRALAAELGMNLRRTYQEQFDWPVTSRRLEGGEETRTAFESAGHPEAARKT